MLFLIISSGALYYFNLLPFFKKGAAVTVSKDSSLANQTTNEDRSIAIPDLATRQNLLPELKEISNEDKNSFVLPVEEKYMDTALEDKDNAQVLSFYLDEGASIKAIFAGTTKLVVEDVRSFPNDDAFNEIQLMRKDNKFWVSYVIYGDVLVNEGDAIEAGQEIAKAKSGGLAFRSGTNLSLWVHNENNDFMKVTKDIFTKK